MIDTAKIIYEQNTEKVWYVEIIAYAAPGSPIYKAIPAWYLKTYIMSHSKRPIHIVTVEESLTTAVVRHVPNSRIFDAEKEALDFIERLYNGEVIYER